MGWYRRGRGPTARPARSGRSTRSVLLPVAAVLVCDAEVFCGSGRIAGRDARASLGERPAPLEVFIRDFLECRSGAELHQHAALAVPPAEARDLGVVAVEN